MTTKCYDIGKVVNIMRHTVRLTLSLLCLTMILCACGADKNFKKAEKYLALGEYFDASTEYKKAYSKTPAKEKTRRGQIAIKMASCYTKINSTGKALAAYQNAIRYNTANTNDLLMYSRQLLKNGEYKKAEQYFSIVLDSCKTYDVENKESVYILAKNGLESAQKAPKWKQEGSRYTIKKMDAFNSRRAEFSPMLAGDEHNQLYFTSTRNDAEGDELSGITGTKPADIFVSTKDDKGKWGKPEQVQGGLNTTFDEGVTSLSVDGREMYLTYCPEDAQYPRYAQIAKSTRADASWGKSSPIQLSADTLSSYAHPAISPDGEWLYFVSDMPGGMGGLDIWRSKIIPGGYGPIENLGSPINTPGNEMFPTFRPNGDFYFSSDGHPGMGGLDIYIATVGNDGKYHLSHPGYPLNSQGDDFGMTFEGPHNQGFFSSNRNDGRGWDHIYSFYYPEIVQTVKGWVYERDGYELTDALVYMVGTDGTNEKISVRGDGSFQKVVKPDVEYVFLATCQGFLNHKEELKVGKVDESTEYTLQFPLASISVPVLIDNIFYDFDKATLRPESETALNELVTLLNQNPNITIELAAHCDYKGSSEYNKSLSERRAKSVVDYLISHGISADRLTPIGYGKEVPKQIRKKQAEKYPFLKEGQQLTTEFILTLSPEQQEICNQLNRRTEFSVLRTTYGMFDENGKLKSIPQTPSNENKKYDIEDIIIYNE